MLVLRSLVQDLLKIILPIVVFVIWCLVVDRGWGCIRWICKVRRGRFKRQLLAHYVEPHVLQLNLAPLTLPVVLYAIYRRYLLICTVWILHSARIYINFQWL